MIIDKPGILSAMIYSTDLPYDVLYKIQEYLPIFSPENRDELKKAVDEYVDNKEVAIKHYGFINNWNVSKVSDMSYLFCDLEEFNDDITGWDVSNVINMDFMFKNAKNFNQILNHWNTEKLRYSHAMFFGSGVRFLPVWYMNRDKYISINSFFIM